MTRKPFGKQGQSKKRNVSKLNPDLLVKKSTPVKEVTTKAPAWTFADAPIDAAIKRNLANRGYEFPTQIQEQSLEPALKGRNILGLASTGTGKTAAFLIPIVEHLLSGASSKRALIVVPTRELALQVLQEFEVIASGMNLRASCFIGGLRIESDLLKLRKTNEVVIGTPGRLLDLSNQGALKLNEFSTLVLDEFDRMLDMGFIQDIRKIVGRLTNRKQTMFFSATADKALRPIIESMIENPVEIQIEQAIAASDLVDQKLIRVQSGADKFKMLLDLIKPDEFRKVLIFAESKRTVNQVGKKLNQSGVNSEVIHGNKSQNYRIKALQQFSTGKVRVLVATDVAARGLDVTDVSHVINYQMPRTMDSYIHRVGRTGRAGKYGQAFTFVD